MANINYLSIADYADKCGVTKQAVYLWIYKGRISETTINGCAFIDVDKYGILSKVKQGRHKASLI